MLTKAFSVLIINQVLKISKKVDKGIKVDKPYCAQQKLSSVTCMPIGTISLGKKGNRKH